MHTLYPEMRVALVLRRLLIHLGLLVVIPKAIVIPRRDGAPSRELPHASPARYLVVTQVFIGIRNPRHSSNSRIIQLQLLLKHEGKDVEHEFTICNWCVKIR